jgi:hypothetical protein
VDDQNSSLAISSDTIVSSPDSTNSQTTQASSDLKVQQKGETQSVEINLFARTDNLLLNVILPLFKTAYNYALKGREYYVAYYNRNILIYNSKLSHLRESEGRDNSEVKISIGLEIKPEKKEADVKTMSPQNKEILDGQLKAA